MEELKIKGIYRHFKGDYYFVEDIAIDSETDKELVIYRMLYGDCHLYARPKDMFLSSLPEGRYSECNEKYRFELMMNNLKHCTGSRNSVNGKIVIKER